MCIIPVNIKLVIAIYYPRIGLNSSPSRLIFYKSFNDQLCKVTMSQDLSCLFLFLRCSIQSSLHVHDLVPFRLTTLSRLTFIGFLQYHTSNASIYRFSSLRICTPLTLLTHTFRKRYMIQVSMLLVSSYLFSANAFLACTILLFTS